MKQRAPRFWNILLDHFRRYWLREGGCPCAKKHVDRCFLAQRAVRPDLVAVSTPSLQFRPHVVKAHEPVRVQARPAQLAVEGLGEGLVGRFPGARDVERYCCLIGPEVRIVRCGEPISNY